MVVIMRRRASADMFSSRETIRILTVPDGTDLDDIDPPWGVGPVDTQILDEGGIMDIQVGHSE